MSAATTDRKQDDLLRRPLYLYDLPAEVLESLTVKTDAETPAESYSDAAPPQLGDSHSQSADRGGAVAAVVGSQACSLCGLSFATVEDQRGHLKSDWHHYNLKMKLRGQKTVSEPEFEKLIGDLDESLSGSDDTESEDDDDYPAAEGTGRSNAAATRDSTLVALLKKQATLADRRANHSGRTDVAESDDGPKRRQRGAGKPPLIYFDSSLLPENTYFGIYRALFTNEELEQGPAIVEAIRKRQLEPISMPKPSKDSHAVPSTPAAYTGAHVFLCMIGGGHFAAMVVSLAPKKSKSSRSFGREATVLAHKTFHRYTTRRKQGGSQSANDNAKGTAHSAGSSLRRYNEQALVEDVRALLVGWKGLLDTADLLFVRATGVTNRRTLFGPYDGQVLRPDDKRLRGFPFSTRRATQSELMRAFVELTRLKVCEMVPPPPEPQQQRGEEVHPASGHTLQSTKPRLSEEEETAQLHTVQIQALIRRSKLPGLLSYLRTNSLSPDFRFRPEGTQQNRHAPTPLHLAAAQGSPAIVSGLLLRAGADPTVRSDAELPRTPFDLAADRATRDAFRVARAELGEDRWNWGDGEGGAHVPLPMSRGEAEIRAERERTEVAKKEADRRRVGEEMLKMEQPQPSVSRGAKGKLLDGGLPKTAQEKREEDARGLTPEQRMRIEREKRARAAEERLRRMQAPPR